MFNTVQLYHVLDYTAVPLVRTWDQGKVEEECIELKKRAAQLYSYIYSSATAAAVLLDLLDYIYTCMSFLFSRCKKTVLSCNEVTNSLKVDR